MIYKFKKMQASLKDSRPEMKVPNLSYYLFFGIELETMHSKKKKKCQKDGALLWLMKNFLMT